MKAFPWRGFALQLIAGRLPACLIICQATCLAAGLGWSGCLAGRLAGLQRRCGVDVGLRIELQRLFTGCCARHPAHTLAQLQRITQPAQQTTRRPHKPVGKPSRRRQQASQLRTPAEGPGSQPASRRSAGEPAPERGEAEERSRKHSWNHTSSIMLHRPWYRDHSRRSYEVHVGTWQQIIRGE